jgi:hypothetical protein
MKYKRSVIEIKIRLDGVEGWNHEPEDMVKFIQDTLNTVCPWYKPEVKLLRTEIEP